MVVGVHGSHMLLPSAFAGAVIDLLPPHKLPDVVSEVIVSLLEDADFHYVNMIRNRSATGVEWLRPIVWRRLDDPAA